MKKKEFVKEKKLILNCVIWNNFNLDEEDDRAQSTTFNRERWKYFGIFYKSDSTTPRKIKEKSSLSLPFPFSSPLSPPLFLPLFLSFSEAISPSVKKRRLNELEIAIMRSALVFFFAYCASPAELSLKVMTDKET